MKRLLTAMLIAVAGLAFAAPAAQAAEQRGGRTGCLVAGTCQAPTYGGPTVTHEGRPYPGWHRAVIAKHHGKHLGWTNAAHLRILQRIR